MNKYVITEAQFASIKESITIDEVRLPDFILASIKGYKTSLGNHPAFPPDDESKFEEKILKKRYYELLSNVKKVDGTKGDITKKNLIEILKNLTIKCKQIESPIKDKLEKICFDFVIETFQIDPTQLNIECAITDNIEPKAPLTPKKMTDEFEDIKHVETLNDEIIKRRLINALIQGASVRISNDVYESALNKIYSLDHRLPELYHDILCINEFLSFIKEQKPSNENLAGEATVNISSESPSIKSEGIIFPILIFETIKGVMELLSSHGLPEIKTDAEYVIAKADFRLAENWDKRLGVGLWDILMNTIGYDNYSTIPYVFVELISLPLPDFQQSMREIFGLTKKGRKLIKDIIHNIERNKSFNEIEASANNSDEFFTPEELIGEVIGETDTFSAGDYTYDVPAFVDSETADHKNMISKSIEDGMN